MTNEEIVQLLEKATINTAVGGLQSPEDVREFIDLTVDQSQPLQNIRVETGIRSSRNLYPSEVSGTVLRDGTENTEPAAGDVKNINVTPKTLDPNFVRGDFDVTFEWLRQNVEEENAESTLNSMFAKQYGKDTVLLAWSGDSTITPANQKEQVKAIQDGFIKQAFDSGNVHDYDIDFATTGYKTAFGEMLALLPSDYAEEQDMLRFYVSFKTMVKYLNELSDRSTTLGDNLITQQQMTAGYMGIPMIPTYGQKDDRVLLTLSSNLSVGYGREMELGQDIYNRAGRIEYTLRSDIDHKIIVDDAIVHGDPSGATVA